MGVPGPEDVVESTPPGVLAVLQLGDLHSGIYCPEGSDNYIDCPNGFYCPNPVLFFLFALFTERLES